MNIQRQYKYEPPESDYECRVSKISSPRLKIKFYAELCVRWKSSPEIKRIQPNQNFLRTFQLFSHGVTFAKKSLRHARLRIHEMYNAIQRIAYFFPEFTRMYYRAHSLYKVRYKKKKKKKKFDHAKRHRTLFVFSTVKLNLFATMPPKCAVFRFFFLFFFISLILMTYSPQSVLTSRKMNSIRRVYRIWFF